MVQDYTSKYNQFTDKSQNNVLDSEVSSDRRLTSMAYKEYKKVAQDHNIEFQVETNDNSKPDINRQTLSGSMNRMGAKSAQMVKPKT